VKDGPVLPKLVITEWSGFKRVSKTITPCHDALKGIKGGLGGYRRIMLDVLEYESRVGSLGPKGH